MSPRRSAIEREKDLRRRAEAQAPPELPEHAGAMTNIETARLVHELQVHQIELELQNEELRQTRDRAERLLTQYTDLYDFAPVGYLSVDRIGAVLQANLTSTRLLGVERSRLIHRRLGLFVAESARTAFSDFLRGVFEGSTVRSCELPLQSEGRGTMWCRLESSLGHDADECHLTITDLSARKAAEEELQLAEQFARDTLDGLSANIAIIDADGLIIRVNKGWRDFAVQNGATEAAVGVGHNYFDVCAVATNREGDASRAFMQGVRDVLSGASAEYQYEYSCDSPTMPRWYSVRAPRFATLEPPRAIVSHQDVTARMQMQVQLLHAQKMEVVGQLAGGIAHDFNNLLTVINGVTDLAVDTVEPGSRLESDLNDIASAGARAAMLTRQLLAFSRKQVMSFESIDIAALVGNLSKLLRRVLSAEIDVSIDCDESTGNALVDPMQLEQVLMNLAVNARDAMPAGGTLRITTRGVHLDAAQTAAGIVRRAGEYVSLTVTDTGTGMTEDVRQRVFEPFFTTKDLGKGTGLGLSTVFGIVAQSHGDITVESTPGVGSTFTILFPRAIEPSRAPTAKRTDAPSTGTETILVVEDQTAVRQLTERLLGNAGYHVRGAASGAEALALLSAPEASFDLMLTDMRMPGMSGPRLVVAARALRPALRVLFTSGNRSGLSSSDREILDGEPFVAKPFLGAELLRAVRDAMHTG